MKLIEPGELQQLLNNGYMLVDTRAAADFVENFIEEAVSVPFNENFIESLQEIVGDEQQVIFVVEEPLAATVFKAAKGTGMPNFYGYITTAQLAQAGLKNDLLILIEPDEFKMDYQYDEFYLLDLRSEDEFADKHIEDAENIPLYMLEQALTDLSAQDSYYIYGNSTQQAVTAASLFKRSGFQRVRPIAGTYDEVAASGVPVFAKKKGPDNKSSQN